jgi:hypothetical protein
MCNIYRKIFKKEPGKRNAELFSGRVRKELPVLYQLKRNVASQ